LEKIGAEYRMKKFKVEVEGEEFIVKIEEIKMEGEITSTRPKTSKQITKKKKSDKIKSESEKEMAAAADISKGDIVAPMPGSVLEINVKKGESIVAGDTLVILEAMKMENEITAVQSGTVKEIKVRVGDSVDAEDLLLVVE